MLVLMVNGSPRREGNTDILLAEVARSAQANGAEVEQVILAEKNIEACNGCLSCEAVGECAISDDMDALYPRLRHADAIVLGTPVYFWTVSGLLKQFMDRTYGLHYQRDLTGKIGAAVVVAGRAGGSTAYETIMAFYQLHRMYPAGGVIAYGLAAGEVRHDREGMEQARRLGRLLYRLHGSR
ncbi:MAG: flavodoxin family protein [Clostridia bacterium]|nr:MAG: flavodoxin family protein [Clostridia bacterium]